MMHRAARSLTINTSNACLVNKFNSSSSSSSSSGRPYTPLPPSCRLHKIYEEKLEVLGLLGYENWYDENANPFYRHPEPELPLRGVAKKSTKQGGQSIQNPLEMIGIMIEPPPSTNTCMKPFLPSPQEHNDQQRLDSKSHLNPCPNSHSTAVDRMMFSNEFTGYESLDSDSDQDEVIDYFEDATDETRGSFLTGYRDSSRLAFAAGVCSEAEDNDNDDKAVDVQNLRKPKTELEHRRWSNRNRIMDRGQLMPDTTNTFLPLPSPFSREPRFAIGSNGCQPRSGGSGAKVRALSPYPHSRSRVMMGN